MVYSISFSLLVIGVLCPRSYLFGKLCQITFVDGGKKVKSPKGNILVDTQGRLLVKFTIIATGDSMVGISNLKVSRFSDHLFDTFEYLELEI